MLKIVPRSLISTTQENDPGALPGPSPASSKILGLQTLKSVAPPTQRGHDRSKTVHEQTSSLSRAADQLLQSYEQTNRTSCAEQVPLNSINQSEIIPVIYESVHNVIALYINAMAEADAIRAHANFLKTELINAISLYKEAVLDKYAIRAHADLLKQENMKLTMNQARMEATLNDTIQRDKLNDQMISNATLHPSKPSGVEIEYHKSPVTVGEMVEAISPFLSEIISETFKKHLNTLEPKKSPRSRAKSSSNESTSSSSSKSPKHNKNTRNRACYLLNQKAHISGQADDRISRTLEGFPSKTRVATSRSRPNKRITESLDPTPAEANRTKIKNLLKQRNISTKHQSATFAEVLNNSLSFGSSSRTLNIVGNEATTIKISQRILNDADFINVHYKNVRIKSPNAIAIHCTSPDEARKLDDLIDLKYKESVISERNVERLPRIKISGFPTNAPAEELKGKLISANPELATLNFRVVDIYSVNTRDGFYTNMIVESELTTHAKIMSMKSLLFGLKKLKIYEQTNLIQCSKCYNFGHLKSRCMKPTACRRCGDEHTHAECTSTKIRCTNCLFSNNTGTTFNSGHLANDPRCPIYKKRLEVVKQKLLAKKK